MSRAGLMCAATFASQRLPRCSRWRNQHLNREKQRLVLLMVLLLLSMTLMYLITTRRRQ